MRRHFVRASRRRFASMARGEAIYASAALNQVQLARYSESDHAITTPIAAPLPWQYARWATLSSGTVPRIVPGALVYGNISKSTALLMGLYLGATSPGVAPLKG
jgi:hypothetical protein